MWDTIRVVSTRRLLLTSVVAAGVVSLAACSSPDDAAPVASVSATPTRPRVAVGGPLEITYRFEPTGGRIENDHTVFVHLVNADGEIVWSDDHEPDVRTSLWQPGQSIEYSRTRFLPALLQPGDVTLEVGLYRGDERLPLAAPRAPRAPGSRAYPAADIQLAPETENVFIIYESGWHPDDFVPDDPYGASKWTQQSATFAFRNPRTDVTLLLEFAGRPGVFGSTPQQVTLVGADNTPIDRFAVESPAVVLRRVPVTAAQLGTGDLAELRLEVDRTFVPAELGTGEQDPRTLGLRVYHVFVEGR